MRRWGAALHDVCPPCTTERHALCVSGAERRFDGAIREEGPVSRTWLRPVWLARACLPTLPTHGVAGGWHDPWDADPLEGVVGTSASATRYGVRWLKRASGSSSGPRPRGWPLEAHIVSPDAAAAPWPSVDRPTAPRALDALEAENQELLGQGIP